jgi:hypothetical protein
MPQQSESLTNLNPGIEAVKKRFQLGLRLDKIGYNWRI